MNEMIERVYNFVLMVFLSVVLIAIYPFGRIFTDIGLTILHLCGDISRCREDAYEVASRGVEAIEEQAANEEHF